MVAVNCIITLLASIHVLRVKYQIKPFQQKSTKVYVPVTKSINFCMLMHVDINDLTQSANKFHLTAITPGP